MPATVRVLLFSMGCLTIWSNVAFAQMRPRDGLQFQEARRISESVETILSRPEFRHFRRLGEATGRSPLMPAGRPAPPNAGGEFDPRGNRNNRQWQPPPPAEPGGVGDGEPFANPPAAELPPRRLPDELPEVDPLPKWDGPAGPNVEPEPQPPLGERIPGLDPERDPFEPRPFEPDADLPPAPNPDPIEARPNGRIGDNPPPGGGVFEPPPQLRENPNNVLPPVRRRPRRADDAATAPPVQTAWDTWSGPSRAGSILARVVHVLAYVILGIVIGFLLFSIFAALRSAFSSTGKAKTARELPALDDGGSSETWQVVAAATHLGRAEQHALAGRFRAAVREMVLAAMSDATEAGLLRAEVGYTPRDYLRLLRMSSVGGFDSPLTLRFRELVRLWEPLAFGRRPAADTHYQQALTSASTFRSMLGRPPASVSHSPHP